MSRRPRYFYSSGRFHPPSDTSPAMLSGPNLPNDPFACPPRFSRWQWLLLIAGMIAALVTAGAVYIWVGRSREHSAFIIPSESPSEAPDVLPPLSTFSCDTMRTNLTEAQNRTYHELADRVGADPSGDYESCIPVNMALLFLLEDNIINPTFTGNSTSEDDVAIVQRFALTVFYFAMNGQDWTMRHGWVTEASECEWHGVLCRDRHVVRLELKSNQLLGSLPPELSKLTRLEIVDLRGPQDIWGEIPLSYFTDLSNLVYFDIVATSVDGTLPSEIEGWSQLRTLELQNSAIEGPIPTELFSLTRLTDLSLGSLEDPVGGFEGEGGGMTGPLPTEIGNLRNLKSLRLDEGSITGGLPDTIGGLTSLRTLYLRKLSKLGGTIPTTLGLLTGLTELHIADCAIRGPIPSEMGNLLALRTIHLGHNEITSTIPSELGQLEGLELLLLRNNRLNGTIPIELSNLVLLDSLGLDGNMIEGSLPDEICQAGGLIGNFEATVDGDVECSCCA